MRLIKLKNGSAVTADQFRAQNSNVQYSDELPSIEYLKTIGASIIEVIVPLTIAETNAPIIAEMDAADLKIIRAIAEGDIERLEAHKTSQALLRAKLL